MSHFNNRLPDILNLVVGFFNAKNIPDIYEKAMSGFYFKDVIHMIHMTENGSSEDYCLTLEICLQSDIHIDLWGSWSTSAKEYGQALTFLIEMNEVV